MVDGAELIINGRHIFPGVRRLGEGPFVPLQQAVPRLGGRVAFSDRGPRLIGLGGELPLEGEIIRDGDLDYVPLLLVAKFFRAGCYWDQSSNTWVLGQENPLLRGKSILLDPGHGGQDRGFEGRHSLEEQLNMDLARRLQRLIELGGGFTLLTRLEGEGPSTQERIETARCFQPFLLVSLHHNSSFDPQDQGTEVLHNGRWQSLRLARCIHGELVGELATYDRGVKEVNHGLLRELPVPAAWVELVFLSNPGDEALARQPSFRQRAAAAIYRGILAALS
ncbi:MAG: N-acetylmuramoyl-L-alanine amidase family protein [Limnochordia bacterium]|jgi:N-acetylmuramoyl-L-alanine amidase|nr:N-acetylmuramoyl-L-alanine amidase [Bacillota bacterium]